MTHAGKVAIVTGAANGIGLAIATKLCAEGARVAICDVDGGQAERQAALLRAAGRECIAVACDVSKADDAAHAVEAVSNTYGGLDILVNNAGILDASPVLDIPEEAWDRVMAVNLKGVFLMCKAAVALLKASPAPRIVNISSVAGRMGGYEASLAYAASKGGILSFSMGLARQLAPFGVTVNCICPGPTESDMVKLWEGEKLRGLTAKIPLGRLGRTSDMASAAAFLTGDEAGFITGLLMDVNGGMYMG